jgi:TonB family protein
MCGTSLMSATSDSEAQNREQRHAARQLCRVPDEESECCETNVAPATTDMWQAIGTHAAVDMSGCIRRPDVRQVRAYPPVPRSHMSVEPMDSTSEIWLAWQGRAINDELRLGRYLGGSDHSAVFLADPAAVAVKLVPALPGLAQSQLSDWNTAAGLAHPHLIRLLETGRCELDGQPYLYAVMEYADQNLAQLLRHRPLSEDEAREVLPPALEALAYLHSRNLVQGQLKPANILAVGDRLKLAADTVRAVSETSDSRSARSVYDPPEARDGSYATAGDIWGLGLTLVEALTRTVPSGLNEDKGRVVLPADFPPTFRELVTGCLSRRPYDRPKVMEIEAWLRRRSAAAVPVAAREPPASAAAIKPDAMPGQTEIPEVARGPATPVPQPPRPLAARPVGPDFAAPETSQRRSFALPIIGAIAVLVLSWAGVRAFRTHREPSPPPVEAARQTPPEPSSGTASVAAGHATPRSGQVNADGVPVVVHAEIPEVPLRARQTIHGHIRVSVRVIVDRDGNVAAALADQAGPSRYFERLAIAAAKKWTFPPADTQAQRVKLLRFEFTRQGTKGRAVSLQ